MDHLDANGIHALVQKFGFQVLHLAWPELRDFHATQVRHQVEANDALVTVIGFLFLVWGDNFVQP